MVLFALVLQLVMRVLSRHQKNLLMKETEAAAKEETQITQGK